MLMPLRNWPVHGGIRPWIGERWSVHIATRRIGRFGVDWFTDAQAVYDFGVVRLFDHGTTEPTACGKVLRALLSPWRSLEPR